MTKREKDKRILLAVHEWYANHKNISLKNPVQAGFDAMYFAVDLAELLVNIIEEGEN